MDTPPALNNTSTVAILTDAPLADAVVA